MYHELTPYQRDRLHATNMWRVAGNMPVIEVPKENKAYWDYWEANNHQAKGEAILKERQRLKEHGTGCIMESLMPNKCNRK